MLSGGDDIRRAGALAAVGISALALVGRGGAAPQEMFRKPHDAPSLTNQLDETVAGRDLLTGDGDHIAVFVTRFNLQKPAEHART